jgi:nitrite reductase/ring-hydroxylating ferredoxin subunit
MEHPAAGEVRVRVPVARAADVPADAGLAVTAEGRPLALFRVDDEIVAIQGQCLHRGGPLALGDLRGTVLTCPWHWWRYDLRTGVRLDDPSVCLERFQVEIEDGQVVVTVPLAHPPESWRDRLLRHAREETARAAASAEPGRAEPGRAEP